MDEITPTIIRQYFIHLQQTNNPGGIHAHYRALKAFLNWYTSEIDDPHWRNPIDKITPPKVSTEPLPGISMPNIQKLLATCDKSYTGQRDRAIILFLLDTGLRRAEFCSLNLSDIDLETGAIQVRAGKGNKDRIVYAGTRARRELMRYLRHLPDLQPSDPLWLTQFHTRLTHAGLRQIFRRRAIYANIPEPQIHDFRRAFAVNSLRNGMDIVTLQRLMGHANLAIITRYLKLVTHDLQQSHAKHGVVDNL